MNNTKQHASSSSQSSTRRLGVLGIGLVMEEAGKGARLVFRYPSAPAPIFVEGGVDESGRSSSASAANHRSPTGVRLSSASDSSSSDPAINTPTNLFFDLPARVVEKLFRPKRPLCGQPLTLNVSGTTFCCRAELFDSQPSTVGGGEGSNHPLVLFSVIVALAPLASSGGAATQFDRANTDDTAPQKRSDLAFNAIRRVHVNLASLCRVLKREELRCRYVSRQCQMLLQVRKEYEAKEGPDDDTTTVMDSNISKIGNTSSSASPTPSSPKDKKTAHPPPVPTKVKKETNNRDNESRPKRTQTQRREYVLQLIEIMLAANCENAQTQTEDSDDESDGDEYKQPLYGNLGRELARVFHCLSKDATTIINPSSLLGANTGEGRVYINRHISVPVVALIAEESLLQTNETEVHPYHTLVFPNLTPSEILKDLQDENVESITFTNHPSSLLIIRILRQVLPITHPRRSLNEVAFDAGIPLPYVMNAVSL